VWARVRADFRNRWLAWLALALAIGLGGAVVLTAAAGARRTATAYPRFLAQAHAEDLYISTGPPYDPEQVQFSREVAQLPQVEVAAPVAAPIVVPPSFTIFTDKLGRHVGGCAAGCSPYHFAAVDRRYGNTIDRPNVLSGRRPRPDRVNEVLVNRAMAKAYDLDVGDTMSWRAFSEGATDQTGRIRRSDGTQLHLQVVGIGVYPNEVVATAPYDALPFLYLTPAYFAKYPHQGHTFAFQVVRLRHGKADLPAFRAALNRILREHGGSPNDLLFSDRTERNAQVNRAIQPQAVALVVFAALLGAALLMVFVQVLARQIFLDADEYSVLQGLGMSRRQLFATSMARVSVVTLVGGVLAVGGAVLASPLMPIGPARLAEPNPGIAFNAAILGLGFVAIVVLVIGLSAIPAWHAATVVGVGSSRWVRRSSTSRLADALAAAGFPPSATTGVRNAVQPGEGRGRVPVRGALVVSGVAIALFIGTFAFTSNLDRLASTPKLYGWNWTFKAGIGFFPVDAPAAKAKIGRDPAVQALAGANFGSLTIAGKETPAVGIDSLSGSLFPTLLEGRAPARNNEVALGTRTLRHAHRSLGDTITVDSAGQKLKLRIVGRAVFPKLGAGSFAPTNLGEGAAVKAALFADPSAPDDRYNLLLIRLKPGADVAATHDRINRFLSPQFFCGGDPDCVHSAERPGDISNFTRIRGTSFGLATALAVLALGLLVHVLVSSVRRRRRDLAVLKTLGFVRREVSAVTAWQATTMAAIALLIGLPLGIVLGSVVWRLFAEQLGVASGVSLPLVTALLAIPATIVLANLTAAVPALLAARTHPATVLRSE
jgi:putative ABC transport system permease protein